MAPFDTSRDKVLWAEKRLKELIWEVQGFSSRRPYVRIIEPDTDRPHLLAHKIKLTEDIPPSTVNLAGEVIHALRTALDNAVFDIAVASGVSDPRNAAFPFAATINDMASALGRCKDVPITLHPFFCGLQPYWEGNDCLWGLNKLSNTDKHRILQPFGTGAVQKRGAFEGTGGGPVEMPDPPVWDSHKNEMIVLIVGKDVQVKYQLDFGLYVAFSLPEFHGQSVLEELAAMVTTVHRTLVSMEAEARRQRIL